MNGSQLMRLDNVGTEINDTHRYFRGLTIGQQTPGFWGVIAWYQSLRVDGHGFRHCIHFTFMFCVT